MTPEEALAEAVRRAGTLAALGAMLEPRCSGQAISQWRTVAAERAVQIERVTGVPRWSLRPDLWDRPGSAAA